MAIMKMIAPAPPDRCCCARRPMPPKKLERRKKSAISAIMPTSMPTSVAKRMSKLRTCDISWAITPWSSSRLSMLRAARAVTAIEACCGSRPVAKALGAASSMT